MLGRSFGGKLPVVGLVITAASVGYDIHEGKSASTAIVGATVGNAVATGAVALGGAAAAAAGAPVILVVVAAVGIGALASWGAESAWTAWVSDDVRKKIDDGIGSTATDFVHSPETAWNAIP